MEEKISVIVPVYNVEQYLIRCIESIISQTYKNLEIILVNDGSTDGSGKLCNSYAQNDVRILVIHKQNGGLSDARNVGIDKATGKYLIFVDSDDWIAKNMVEMMYKVIKNQHTKLAVCEATYAYEHCIVERKFSGESFVLDKEKAIQLLIEDRKFRTNAWNKMYEKELWDTIRFPKGKHYEDVHIMHEIYDLCDKVAFIDSGLYYYYQREDSIVHLPNIESYLDFVNGTIERYKFLAKKYPDMISRLSAAVISSVLVIYRNMGIYHMRISHDVDTYLKNVVKQYKERSFYKYFSPRFKLEFILFQISPKVLCLLSSSIQRIYRFFERLR